MSTPAISCQNLSYAARGKYLVKEVSFDAPMGQKVAILGHNGAGKSTLIDLIAQALRPQSGKVSILGQPFAKLDRRRLGVVFDSLNAFPLLKVKEIIRYFQAIYGIGASPELEEKIEALQLREHWDKTITLLSKGERKKVWILLATMHSPDLLILDEATSELDPFSRSRCWEKVILSDPKRSILFTTHSWEEAQRYADSIMFMRQGLIPQGPIATERLLSEEFLPFKQKVVVQPEPALQHFVSAEQPKHYFEDKQLHILPNNIEQTLNAIRKLTPSYSVVNTGLMDVYALLTKNATL
jgi:ABC-2 type transport system ATP-binding protein